MLSNLSELQTFTLFHREEFSKECISNISEVILQKIMKNSSHQVAQAYVRLSSTYSSHI